ncbi:MAG TPA: hypothetical protein HPP81_02785 [Deltaproteobacteria bacterium]|jgi:hypothetical protein|nr:hypothetical protein [Deltaproteobacteria bacterium]
MARGNSGRIVLEVDVDLKNSMYARLEEDNLKLKAWFIQRAKEYLESPKQLAVQLTIKDLLEKGGE